jgi:hypothetical protein
MAPGTSVAAGVVAASTVATRAATARPERGSYAWNGLGARLREQCAAASRLFSPVRDMRAAIRPVTIGVEKEVPLNFAMP